MDSGLVAKRLSYRVKSTRAARDRAALVDLTAVVEDILAAGHDGATIHLTIRPVRKPRHSSDSQSHSDITMTDDDEGSNRKRRSTGGANQTGSDAILVVYTRDRSFFSALRTKSSDEKSRTKRSTSKRKHKVSGDCRKLDFTIDFEIIGWDKWIIYPATFKAYRCGGECRYPSIQALNPTNHAVLQGLMRKRDRNSAPWPCCVATKLQPINMLYYEHEEMVVRRHEEMVVDQCSCQ